MLGQVPFQKGWYVAILAIFFFSSCLLYLILIKYLYDDFWQTDELEEGEIAVSGDSHMDHQLSGSWIHDRDEGEDEQVLQKPKIKRKRSLRVRPRHATERPEEKSGSEMASHLAVQADHKYQAQLRTDPESKLFGDSNASRHEQNTPALKNKRTLPSRRVANTSKLHGSPKSSRLNCMSVPSQDAGDHSRESWEGKPINSSGSSAHGTKMTEIIQRRVCIFN